MTKRNWHKGAPPSIGWWAASINRNPMSIRWWDGRRWSTSVLPSATAKEAAIAAAIPTGNDGIEWCQRWWE